MQPFEPGANDPARAGPPHRSVRALSMQRGARWLAVADGMPYISIIIVNHNGRHFLDDCLGSILRQSIPRRYWEVLLIDNGSHDGSVAYVGARYPWVRVLQAGKNLGFARANNLGFKHARGRLLALLNNDTIVDRHWLKGLVDALESDPHAGAVGSKILFRKYPDVINSAGLNLYRDGRGGDRGFRQLDVGQFDHEQEVFGACAASVLIRREMITDAGAFDPRFFVYCEDLDLAWRARLRGWRFLYTPQSVVYHVHCGTSGEGSPFFVYHVERNRVFVNLKNAPPWLALRSLAVFGARAARKWLRVVALVERGQAARQEAAAYLRAGISLLIHIPEMLYKRILIRGPRRKVHDRAVARLMAPPPPRGASQAPPVVVDTGPGYGRQAAA